MKVSSEWTNDCIHRLLVPQAWKRKDNIPQESIQTSVLSLTWEVGRVSGCRWFEKTGYKLHGIYVRLHLVALDCDFFFFIQSWPSSSVSCFSIPVLPVRRRVQVRPARLQDLRQERRRHHRLQRVHLRPVHHITRQLRAETQLGLQHVRPGRRRQDHTGGDAGDHRGIALCSTSSYSDLDWNIYSALVSVQTGVVSGFPSNS